MSTNLFESCNTEAEIMKRIFELSSDSKYSRPELLSMSNVRRAELKSSKSNSLKFHKVVIPLLVSNPSSNVKQIVVLDNPKTSTSFEMTSDNKYII